MSQFQLLRSQADLAYKELEESLEGVSEELAWARVELQPGEYLHSEGSILSIVAHLAGCRQVYGSAAYRGLEVRWRDTVDQLNRYWPDWDEAKRCLREAHQYWLGTWEQETDFERPVKNFREVDWPSWKIVTTVTLHDTYHAGQIQMLRSVLAPSSTPPPNEAALWKQYCEPLPSW